MAFLFLYEGQEQCTEVVAYMRSIGFGRNDLPEGGRCEGWGGTLPEKDVLFHRDA